MDSLNLEHIKNKREDDKSAIASPEVRKLLAERILFKKIGSLSNLDSPFASNNSSLASVSTTNTTTNTTTSGITSDSQYTSSALPLSSLLPATTKTTTTARTTIGHYTSHHDKYSHSIDNEATKTNEASSSCLFVCPSANLTRSCLIDDNDKHQLRKTASMPTMHIPFKAQSISRRRQIEHRTTLSPLLQRRSRRRLLATTTSSSNTSSISSPNCSLSSTAVGVPPQPASNDQLSMSLGAKRDHFCRTRASSSPPLSVSATNNLLQQIEVDTLQCSLQRALFFNQQQQRVLKLASSTSIETDASVSSLGSSSLQLATNTNSSSIAALSVTTNTSLDKGVLMEIDDIVKKNETKSTNSHVATSVKLTTHKQTPQRPKLSATYSFSRSSLPSRAVHSLDMDVAANKTVISNSNVGDTSHGTRQWSLDTHDTERKLKCLANKLQPQPQIVDSFQLRASSPLSSQLVRSQQIQTNTSTTRPTRRQWSSSSSSTSSLLSSSQQDDVSYDDSAVIDLSSSNNTQQTSRQQQVPSDQQPQSFRQMLKSQKLLHESFNRLQLSAHQQHQQHQWSLDAQNAVFATATSNLNEPRDRCRLVTGSYSLDTVAEMRQRREFLASLSGCQLSMSSQQQQLQQQQHHHHQQQHPLAAFHQPPTKRQIDTLLAHSYVSAIVSRFKLQDPHTHHHQQQLNHQISDSLVAPMSNVEVAVASAATAVSNKTDQKLPVNKTLSTPLLSSSLSSSSVMSVIGTNNNPLATQAVNESAMLPEQLTSPSDINKNLSFEYKQPPKHCVEPRFVLKPKFSVNSQTGITYELELCNHKCICNNDAYHPENSKRILVIWQRLHETQLMSQCCRIESREATLAELQLCHTNIFAQYFGSEAQHRLKMLAMIDASSLPIDGFLLLDCGGVGVDIDTPWNEEFSSRVARLAAGCVIEATLAVASGRLKNAFAIVRPPGHHSEPNQPMGFCIFNNIAIAARSAQVSLALSRILIVDFDIHHGNGSQKMFYEDSSVLCISIHRHDNGSFFPGTGFANELGANQGLGFNINIAWCNDSMGDAEYLAAFRTIVLPVAREFQPELVIVACGFDAARGHSSNFGGYQLSPAIFGWMTKQLMEVANERVVLCLEGGYKLDVIADCAEQCVRALLNDRHIQDIDDNEFTRRPLPSAIDVLKEIAHLAAQYWPSVKGYISMIDLPHWPSAYLLSL